MIDAALPRLGWGALALVVVATLAGNQLEHAPIEPCATVARIDLDPLWRQVYTMEKRIDVIDHRLDDALRRIDLDQRVADSEAARAANPPTLEQSVIELLSIDQRRDIGGFPTGARDCERLADTLYLVSYGRSDLIEQIDHLAQTAPSRKRRLARQLLATERTLDSLLNDACSTPNPPPRWLANKHAQLRATRRDLVGAIAGPGDWEHQW